MAKSKVKDRITEAERKELYATLRGKPETDIEISINGLWLSTMTNHPLADWLDCINFTDYEIEYKDDLIESINIIIEGSAL